MRSDPIADMLTCIRNASRAEHEKVDIPASKLKLRVAELLKDEGFIKNFRLLEDPKQGTLRVYLNYGTGNEKMISGIVRVSTPGRRVYVTRDRVPSVLGGMGVALLSTSRGVFTDRDARKQGVGGEVLAYGGQVQGRTIQLALGYSHPVIFPLPEGITAEIDKQTLITLRGADKALLGQTASKLRMLRKPDPYKGKGIKYADEVVRRKVGKKAGAAAK